MTQRNLRQTVMLLGMTIFALVASTTTTHAQIHDQQAGSGLIYNYFTSDSVTPWGQNTTFTITNTNTTTLTQVRMFYVNGDTGAVKTNSICLPAGATWSGLMSDENPDVTGYIVALAIDSSGAPRNFNWLIGNAAITINSGHRATLSAIAWSFEGPPAANQLTVDRVPSPLDGQMPLLIINRINGTLVNQMVALGNVTGVVTVNEGRAVPSNFPFTLNSSGPQLRRVIDDSLPLSGTTLSTVIPGGRTAFMKLNSGINIVTGAILYFSPNTGISTGSFTGGNNLRHTGFTNQSLTVPIIKPLRCFLFF